MMVSLVCGRQGVGKTRKMVDLANEDIKLCNGDVVFIDADNRQTLQINYKVRFVNAMDFNIKNIDMFHGFLRGIISNNYDIEKIYIDRLLSIIELSENEILDIIGELEKIGNKYNVDFVLSISRDKLEIPEELHQYVIFS
ncbi:hypothetical protein SAMN05660462_02271 [Proteiniborus ethanoligenes]|uniref:Twitching motility protein PilT n=2 Tax=Proteiniborus ethanoligenes TaxID=415015 RepID=A0A1H3RAI6_9FIRM|nr:hypothetical protein SAMN05660462_02271 [Proteiniborus ethanoligenes]